MSRTELVCAGLGAGGHAVQCDHCDGRPASIITEEISS
jgi:hypothetical protein